MYTKKKLPIGIENFEKLRKEDFYYIDKTGLIRELLYNWGEVNLFTRPRRFGKSLNMSMLKCFFELGGDSHIFDGLEITNDTELCEKYMGKFPVISISLKEVNGDSFASARSLISAVIGKEAMRFQFLLDSDRLTQKEKEMYSQLIQLDPSGKEMFRMSDPVLIGSLQTLSLLLEKHFEKKVMILIDEYDVPLAKAFERDYYDEMVLLLRNLFEQSLKTNASMQFAVLTGCMRISKESIFTGLNNMRILSVSDVQFDEYFGFTNQEVRDLLEYYGVSERYAQVKEWYDGYRFGEVDVYCPWDVVNYCDKLRTDANAQPENYWSNTSSNDAVRRFIQMSDKASTKRELEHLIAGGVIRKEIQPNLTYKDMYDSVDHLWSVLYTTGYLTQRGKAEGNIYNLAIPNLEIRNIFTSQVMKLFKENVKKDGQALNHFCDALKKGDTTEVERQFEAYLKKTISIRDTFAKRPMKENFYHGILLGILGFKEDWSVFSNRESGDGYSDILVEIEEEETGIVLEVKYAEDGHLEAACENALQQIDEQHYADTLYEDGMKHILKYGIACYKKHCKVVKMQ